MKLLNHKQVMEAFLQGHKLVHKNYNGDDIWLYLSKDGWISEEDGATAKADRVPICWRLEDPEWEIVR